MCWVSSSDSKGQQQEQAQEQEQEQAQQKELLQNELSEELYKILIEICGGDESICRENLMRLSRSSVSFPNKNFHSLDGKPHNVEIKVALALYHGRKKRKRDSRMVELISELGLSRQVSSPYELGKLVCDSLSERWDVRVTASGILYLVTHDRSRALRNIGKLPCPQCVKWCKGEKGLWWHQQREHGVHHSQATSCASNEKIVLAIVPYDYKNGLRNNNEGFYSNQNMRSIPRGDDSDVFELARQGDLKAIKSLIQDEEMDIKNSFDRKGASPLHWAAGSGQLNVVIHLIEKCQLDPNLGQRGKRSFSGRTALHWSARNGHINVVKYLLEKCKADIDASTVDGTTAFGWACWQGHLEIMKYLHFAGCDVHKKNSFGCNAILWAAQGADDTLDSLKWLHSIGCEMGLVNSNGHSALHKAAQRGRQEVVCWLMQNYKPNQLEWIGPDGEGCCPSDLAGMEGHADLACLVSQFECSVAVKLVSQGAIWLHESEVSSKFDSDIWGANGGVRRMQHALLNAHLIY